MKVKLTPGQRQFLEIIDTADKKGVNRRELPSTPVAAGRIVNNLEEMGLVSKRWVGGYQYFFVTDLGRSVRADTPL